MTVDRGSDELLAALAHCRHEFGDLARNIGSVRGGATDFGAVAAEWRRYYYGTFRALDLIVCRHASGGRPLAARLVPLSARHHDLHQLISVLAVELGDRPLAASRDPARGEDLRTKCEELRQLLAAARSDRPEAIDRAGVAVEDRGTRQGRRRPTGPPFAFIPGATEELAARARQYLLVRGYGGVEFELNGTLVWTRRDAARLASGRSPGWGEGSATLELLALDLEGATPLLGPTRLRLDPALLSTGQVAPPGDDSLAAVITLNCFPVLDLAGAGLEFSTRGESLELVARVIRLPPAGDVARSSNSPPLFDATGSQIGEIVSFDLEIGRVIRSEPASEPGAQADC